MPQPTPTADPCPCGSALPYAGCCGRWHAGPQPAPDAEALMRSRYSAYVRGLHGYLLATWAAETRPAAIDPDPPGLKWLGLEVRRRRTIDADHAEVEFVARSKLGGRAVRLHETSRFERRDGHWVYVDGVLHGMLKAASRGKPRRLEDFDPADLVARGAAGPR